MQLREQEPLWRHTTLRTGGPARYFAKVASPAEIGEAWHWARRRGLPVFILGGGSNVLASDAGFDGLVLQMAARGMDSRPSPPDRVEVVAEAGEVWDDLVGLAVQRSWGGLENLSLIPGTVGGAVIGNIGAYGAEIRDVLSWVEALDWRTGQVRRFERSQCDFAYRHSFFKTGEGRNFLVVRAAFALGVSPSPKLGYREVEHYFAARGIAAPTLSEVRNAVVHIRRGKLPDPERVGTAGSFFKNPLLQRAEYEALARRFPGLPGHPETPESVKVSLGWILDKVCGL